MLYQKGNHNGSNMGDRMHSYRFYHAGSDRREKRAFSRWTILSRDGEDTQAFMNALSPGYFEAMGIPLLDGPDFDLRDVRENAKAAIERHYFGNKSAIGRHLGKGGGNGYGARYLSPIGAKVRSHSTSA